MLKGKQRETRGVGATAYARDGMDALTKQLSCLLDAEGEATHVKYTYVSIHIKYTCVHMYVCMYVCMYICLHVYIHIYALILEDLPYVMQYCVRAGSPSSGLDCCGV